MKVTGNLVPLKDKVLVSDMNFGFQTTRSGIVITSDDGKATGVKPRWGKVFAVGPEQKDVQVGEWVCVEHGRWTRTIDYENVNGEKVELRMVEPSAIMLVSEEPPTDVDVRSLSTT